MKDVLTHQDLAAVYAPEYLAEGEAFDQDEEFLYEETLYENDQIDAITTYLAESYESEDLDTIFEMVEDLQSYMLEFFEFDNENEVNEAILMLDSESLVDIFEDIYEGTGIVEDTYHDITESVQFVYDSADVIEEGVLSEYFNRGKKNPNKKGGLFRQIDRNKKAAAYYLARNDNRKAVDNENTRVTQDEIKRGTDPAEAAKKGHREAIKYRKAQLSTKRRGIDPIYKRIKQMPESFDELTQDDYDYLMEEAAILSTLKVAEMLSEAGVLDFVKNQIQKGLERDRAAKQALQPGSKFRRSTQREVVKRLQPLTNYSKKRLAAIEKSKGSEQQAPSEKQPYQSRGTKKNRPKPTIGNKKAKRGVYKPELSVAKGKRNPSVRKSEQAVEQPTKKSTTPFDASSGAKLTSVTSVPKPQRKRARLKMKKPSVNTVKMGTGKTTDTSGSISLEWEPGYGNKLRPFNKERRRSYGGAANAIAKAYGADPNKVSTRKND